MKLCAILLSLSGLIGGVETILSSGVSSAAKLEIAYPQSGRLPMPGMAPPDPSRAVAEALADAQARDTSIAELLRPRQDR